MARFQWGQLVIRTKEKGFLQPEPVEQVDFPRVQEVRPAAEAVTPQAALPGFTPRRYSLFGDVALWVFDAFRMPITAFPKLTPQVEWSKEQPVIVQASRTIHHVDPQKRLEAANTLMASTVMVGGPGGKPRPGVTLNDLPGGAAMRSSPRYPFVVRVPRFSLLPAELRPGGVGN